MNICNDNNNNGVTILSQLDQTGVWRGGGGGGGVEGRGTRRVSEACFYGESCCMFVRQWDVDVQRVCLFNLQD